MQKISSDYLSRPVVLHCCKDGTLTIRMPGEKVFNGVALPVFSVNTREEAEAIQIALCARQYESHPLMPGKPWYVVPKFGGELDDLFALTPRIEALHKQLSEKRTATADAG